MNWRYYVPLTLIKLGEYRQCLRWLRSWGGQSTLGSTAIPFTLGAAYCSIKLGHTLWDDYDEASLSTIEGQSKLRCACFRAVQLNPWITDMMRNRTSCGLVISPSVGARGTEAAAKLYFSRHSSLWLDDESARRTFLSWHNRLLCELMLGITNDGKLLQMHPVDLAFPREGTVDFNQESTIKLYESVCRRPEGVDLTPRPNCPCPLNVVLNNRRLTPAAKVRYIKAFCGMAKFPALGGDSGKSAPPDPLTAMCYYCNNMTDGPVIDALLDYCGKLVPDPTKKATGLMRSLAMSLNQGNQTAVARILKRADSLSQEFLLWCLSSCTESGCYMCMNRSPPRSCTRCKDERNNPHCPAASFERVCDVLISFGLKSVPQKLKSVKSHPLGVYVDFATSNKDQNQVVVMDDKKKKNEGKGKSDSTCSAPGCSVSGKLLKCSRCRIPYCSADCQLKDWPEHKKVCQVHTQQAK